MRTPRQPVTRLKRTFETLMASTNMNELRAHWNYLHDRLWVHPSPDVIARFYPGGAKADAGRENQ